MSGRAIPDESSYCYVRRYALNGLFSTFVSMLPQTEHDAGGNVLFPCRGIQDRPERGIE